MDNSMRAASFSVVLLATAVNLLAASAAAPAASDTVPLSPATTMWALRGLTQTVSAEPMGEGRLTFGLTATWFGHEASPQNADVLTGIAAFSFGLSPYVDIFGSVVGYGMIADSSNFGQGSVSAGLRGSLPLPQRSPLRLGAQLGVVSGTSTNKINENNSDGYYRNNSDGYSYFETHIYYDCILKIIETLMFGNDSLGIKFHFNQGAAMELERNNRQLLLLGAGIQGSVHPRIVVGLEFNSRTNLLDIHIQHDPLWLTPSVLFRTPYYFNVQLGVDVALSKERTGTRTQALDPYRVFGSFASSFDLLAAKRRADRERAMREKAERERMVREAKARNEVLASTARVDSSAMANARDSLKRKTAMMAQKSIRDSIAIADLKRKLNDERSKRSDVEKKLLSTGLLLLDAVYFESGKAQISINSFPYLNIIGKILAKYPKLQIEVSGHTDNVGRYDRNIALSQARAEAVRRYLIQVAPDLLTRISARGYGPTEPKATNTTQAGRKMNRRTELQVLNKDALKEYN